MSLEIKRIVNKTEKGLTYVKEEMSAIGKAKQEATVVDQEGGVYS